MADDTAFSVFVDESTIENLVTCTGKTEAPTEQLLHGADKNKVSLKNKFLQNVKFTQENHMAMILATILMKRVTVTL